jgi:hypothetical protein
MNREAIEISLDVGRERFRGGVPGLGLLTESGLNDRFQVGLELQP